MYSCTRNVQEYSFLWKPGKYIPGEFIFLRGVRWSGIKFREFKLPLLYRNFSSRNLTPESLFLGIIRNLYSWLGIVFLKNSGILIPEKNSSRKIYSQKKITAEDYSRNISSRGMLVPEKFAQSSLPLTSIMYIPLS